MSDQWRYEDMDRGMAQWRKGKRFQRHDEKTD